MATEKELMNQLCKRIESMEIWRADMEHWRAGVDEIVLELKKANETLRDIAAAVRIFTRIGQAFRWLAWIAASLAALKLALKDWLGL